MKTQIILNRVNNLNSWYFNKRYWKVWIWKQNLVTATNNTIKL